MILAALNDYYRRLSAAGGDDIPPPFGFAIQKVGGAIQLDRDGRFLGLAPLSVAGAKGKPHPKPMMVPQPPGRTSGVEAAFLCDTGGYLLGTDLKGKPERVRQQFAASAALHRQVLADTDSAAARAVLGHFATWNPAALGDDHEDLLAGFLVFMVDGALAHDDEAVRAAWCRHVEGNRSDKVGQCMVSGEDGVPLARLHPPIKGAGGQSSGTYLVSFNFDAATSYGAGQDYAVPVGEAAAFSYAAALNHLLRQGRERVRTIGDMTMVIWADRPAPAAEALLLQLFDPTGLSPDEGAPAEDTARAKQVRDALDRILAGQAPEGLAGDKGTRFYLLGLSPNAARLSVRLWCVATLGEFLDRVREHQQDLSLITDHRERPPYPALWTLVSETRPKDANGRARGRADNDRRYKLHADLLRAAVTGGPYPAALLPELLARFRADGHVTHPRVALLKAVVQRAHRIHRTESKELRMALDDTRTETGYLLGRLFAALERLQTAAQGQDLNRTIRDSHMGAASATPRSAFNHLLPLSEAHRRKGRRDNPGGVVVADRVVQRVMDELPDIPATLDPENQALFFLGYYQQRQDFFTSKRGEAAADQTV